MKVLHFSSNNFRIFSILAAALIAGAAFIPVLAVAGDKPLNTGNPDKPETTHITADKLLVDSEAKFAEFIGAVRLTRGSTVITADRLKIFFKGGVDNTEKVSATRESINKIIAKGNVRIKLDDGVATTEQAEFISETSTYILSGENSKVISGDNSISGSKITLYRTDGRITVEGSSKNRVEAMIYSGKKGVK